MFIKVFHMMDMIKSFAATRATEGIAFIGTFYSEKLVKCRFIQYFFLILRKTSILYCTEISAALLKWDIYNFECFNEKIFFLLLCDLYFLDMGEGGYSQILSYLALCKIFSLTIASRFWTVIHLQKPFSLLSLFFCHFDRQYISCVSGSPYFSLQCYKHFICLFLNRNKLLLFILISLNLSSLLICSVHLFNICLMLFFSQISTRICYCL